MIRKQTMTLLKSAAFLLLCLAGWPTLAQDLQSRPITLVVGFPPGGSNDIVARATAARLEQVLGVSVIVANKPGANAVIGADFVAKSPPDGHTLLVSNAGPMVIAPHITPQMPYETLRDFAAITPLAGTPEIFVVHPTVAATNLRELIALAKGRSVSIASSGAGGMPHLVIEMLRNAAGEAKILHVPYKGATLAANDVIGGHVEGLAGDLASIYRLVKDQKVRAVALTGRSRSDFLPEVPTAAEQGFSGLVAENWIGLLAPARTPRPIVERVHAAVMKAASHPQLKEQFNAVGLSLTTMPSPEAFQQFLREDKERWAEVVKQARIKIE